MPSVVFLFLWRQIMNKFTKITSRENSNIKEIIQLQKSAKTRKESGFFVLEGLRLCLDAVENGFVPQKVFLSSSQAHKNPDLIDKFSNAKEVFEASDNVFEKMSDTVNPQGILCTFKIPKHNNIVKKDGKYIALENIQDPSNLGAISRTAEAFGVDGLIIQGGCDPYSSKSLRASMGALLRLPVIETDNMFELFNKYTLTSYASVVRKDVTPISNIKFSEGCAIIIGNEANGVSDKTISSADCLFTIPMSGKAESLNAAVAASIIIWEICK